MLDFLETPYVCVDTDCLPQLVLELSKKEHSTPYRIVTHNSDYSGCYIFPLPSVGHVRLRILPHAYPHVFPSPDLQYMWNEKYNSLCERTWECVSEGQRRVHKSKLPRHPKSTSLSSLDLQWKQTLQVEGIFHWKLRNIGHQSHRHSHEVQMHRTMIAAVYQSSYRPYNVTPAATDPTAISSQLVLWC
jgi:hypothetical protein